MKKNLYLASVLVAILNLSGCSSTPSAKMTNVNGKFYMVGDSNCAYYKKRDDNSILCANENKQTTGYRNALTDQEIQYGMHRERIQQAESAEASRSFQNSLNGLNQTVNSINRNMSNQVNSFDASQYDLSRQREKPVNCSGVIYGNAYNMNCR